MTAPATVYTPEVRPLGDDQETLRKFLERHRSAIVSAAANRISPERVLKVALIAATKSPLLMHDKMDKLSVLRAIMEAASLGLEVGAALGEAYLVPFWATKRKMYECQMIIGYRGIVNLARRSGSITGVDARPVFAGEQFEPHYGTDPKIVHVPRFDVERVEANLLAVYVVWHLAESAGGGVQFDIMSKAEVDAIRKRSKAGDSGPWVTDYVEMAKKSVARRGGKLVPMSVELADALEDDARREFGDLDIGTVTEEEPTTTTEVKPSGAAALLKAKVAEGKPATTPTTEAEYIEGLRAVQRDGGALTPEQEEELRQWAMDHPEGGQ